MIKVVETNITPFGENSEMMTIIRQGNIRDIPEVSRLFIGKDNQKICLELDTKSCDIIYNVLCKSLEENE